MEIAAFLAVNGLGAIVAVLAFWLWEVGHRQAYNVVFLAFILMGVGNLIICQASLAGGLLAFFMWSVAFTWLLVPNHR